MTTVVDHYHTHLGPIYSWIVGDIDAALTRSAAELESFNLPNNIGGVAVDLGAGFGLHALPLAQRGYSVTAIDSCPQLLEELRTRSGLLPISTVAADILEFPKHLQRPPDVVLCMGDTLTHLPSVAAVGNLLSEAARSLVKEGVFVTTFRDYVSAPLQGDRRFIAVRSDAKRILTCFLEYAQDTVVVHDLLHQWESGRWHQQVSSYPKLRLAPEWVASQLSSHGLAVRRTTTTNGMVCLIATKS
jgi:2-polyprenyl-3-methyl-5-hydroxy-6-metoxy-1,4-benzoquinol methylase